MLIGIMDFHWRHRSRPAGLDIFVRTCKQEEKGRFMEADGIIRIWRATPDELATVEAIFGEYYVENDVSIRDTPEQLRRYLRDGSGVWLAACGEEMAGCVALRPLPAQAGACEVKRLYVKAAFRGRGIADALMDALEAYARTCGYETVYLDTKSRLQAAFRFYARRGYEACERYNDNLQADIFMRRGI
jgi:ribosomal protein S18 acetylase RimI-like enzyme